MASRIGFRKLTQKGLEAYEERVEEYLNELDKLKEKVNKELSRSVDTISDLKRLENLHGDIECQFKAYERVYLDLSAYLKETGTEHSMQLHNVQQNLTDALLDEVQKKLKIVDDKISRFSAKENENVETKSVCSNPKSAHSSTCSAVMKQRAKMEAAKVRLQFTEKKAAIERKQNELKINMDLLESQRELEEAEVELKVMKEMLDDGNQTVLTHQTSAKIKRIEEFVENQQTFLKGESNAFHVENRHVEQSPGQVYSEQGDLGPEVSHLYPPHVAGSLSTELKRGNTGMLDPSAKPYLPSNVPSYRKVEDSKAQLNLCTELSRHIIKRDLIISRLSKFSERPEHFAVWQNSFIQIMDELNVSANEEMDLLVRYLGPDSSRQAESIRTSYACDPERGLRKIWERLRGRYASPELVESALKMKLASFPKLTNKEPSKLYDLVDIVSEIHSAKNNPTYATLLAHYDSSTGVTPIINKLPQGLQEKWTQEATKYKERYRVPYPPFDFFLEFIERQSRIRNDPSFTYDTQPPVSRVGKFHPQVQFLEMIFVFYPERQMCQKTR